MALFCILAGWLRPPCYTRQKMRCALPLLMRLRFSLLLHIYLYRIQPGSVWNPISIVVYSEVKCITSDRKSHIEHLILFFPHDRRVPTQSVGTRKPPAITQRGQLLRVSRATLDLRDLWARSDVYKATAITGLIHPYSIQCGGIYTCSIHSE